jgi:soluble lytic murein transglycosylase-like protein
MKNSTVLAAAFAAGLTTFAANAQQEGSKQVSMVPAGTIGTWTRDMRIGKDEAAKSKAAQAKRGTTSEEAFHAAKVAKADIKEPRPKDDAVAVAIKEPRQKDDAVTVAAVIKEPRRKDDAVAVAAAIKEQRQKDDAVTVAAAINEPGQKDDVVTVAAEPQDRYKVIIERYASLNGIPIDLAHAVITVESNYKPYSLGRAGEVGLMQIKPATAKMMGYDGSTTGLFDPETNIKFGMKYLGKARKLGDGTTCGTILKYNAGHAAKRMNPVSRDYCNKVKRHLAGLGADA